MLHLVFSLSPAQVRGVGEYRGRVRGRQAEGRRAEQWLSSGPRLQPPSQGVLRVSVGCLVCTLDLLLYRSRQCAGRRLIAR